MSNPLTPALRDQHEQKEAIIRRNIDGFRELAEALQWIRDNRTYLQTYSTFETYCREQWNFGRHYVNRMIAGNEVVESLPPEVVPMVTTERVARAVAKVEPSIRVEVVEKAVAHAKSEGRDKITARDVQEMTRPSSKLPPARTPSNGCMYAAMAISQLEKIDERDTERAEAFAIVQNYITKNAPAPSSK